MQYQLRLSDAGENHSCVLTLDEATANQYAIDVVFDVIGAENIDSLVEAGVLPAGQVDDLKALQQYIFDRDEQGLLIKESAVFKGNGRDINPDAPLKNACTMSERDGMKYYRLDLVVTDTSLPAGAKPTQQATSAGAQSPANLMEDLARAMFLHQIGIGFAIDVTKDNTDIDDLIAWAEKEQYIEIDVKRAAYKLTERGKRVHDSYIEEAQNLIKKFDIYCDVDVDRSGTAHFDTGAGRDLRIAAFEMEGVDPFRARFLLGLNDGEWDKLSNWPELIHQESFYADIFAPVERAASIEEIGEDRLAAIMDQGKAKLRQ
ncbi:MAG: hypothetical protein DKT66_00925 [Candidatus Melainabacteria bacterium]|nr:MAG: hypothetical protein DKT66_00925 [Candidatus Melainabacteria bacterium]